MEFAFENMRGQGYDVGSKMAGSVKGVQRGVRSENNKAMYVHCAAQCLNLAFVKAYQIPTVTNVMCLLQEICLFFDNSPKR